MAFAAYPVLGNGFLRYAALFVGGALIATATLRLCPLYLVLGLRTCDCE